MLIKIFFTIFAVLIYLYLFWSKLKEDYIQSQIFTTAFYSLFGIGIGTILADNFAPAWWFWISLLLSFLGLGAGILRFKLRLLEVMEAAILSSLSIYANFFLYDYLINYRFSSVISFCVLVLLIILFYLLNKHYKKFSWYKSGRVGFSGLTVLGLFFLIRAVIAKTGFVVLSFVGINDLIISGILAFSSFLVVFNLAREV